MNFYDGFSVFATTAFITIPGDSFCFVASTPWIEKYIPKRFFAFMD